MEHESFNDYDTVFGPDVQKKRTGQPSSNPDGNLNHPLCIIANALVSHIEHYPTLICLSMTCRTFHHIIHKSQTILPATFLNLEYEYKDGTYHKTHPGILGVLTGEGEHWGTCGVSALPDYETARWSRTWDSTYDILRINTCELPTLDWLPCYGCMRIKRAQTDFFRDESRGCHELLGCSFARRRCISCNIATEGQMYFRRPLKYLNDMPRGIAGFRLRCTCCRNIEWVQDRPRRRQEALKLCGVCFERHLAAQKMTPDRMLRELWDSFINLPVEPAKSRSMKKDCIMIVDPDNGWGDPGMNVAVRSSHRFDTLDADIVK